MKHHELEVESKKNSKRAGRGISAGRGKTAGRGTKGQKARSGGKVRRGFEGGQIPLAQRIPKNKGFNSRPSGKITITTGELAEVSGTTIDAKSLAEANVIDSQYRWVKLIDKGEVSQKLTVKLPAISTGAKKRIEAAGGTFTETEATKRPKKKKE